VIRSDAADSPREFGAVARACAGERRIEAEVVDAANTIKAPTIRRQRRTTFSAPQTKTQQEQRRVLVERPDQVASADDHPLLAAVRDPAPGRSGGQV
jgi:hypothetical protein